MRIDILLYDAMDLMDFAGPFEVLVTANRLLSRQGRAPAFDVGTFSANGGDVTTYGGVGLRAHHPADEVIRRGTDVLIVPGVVHLDKALVDPELLGVVAQSCGCADVVASVCTGAFLLGATQQLSDHRWTTHWEDVATLAASHPGGVRARVVDDGTVITAGGVASGLDLGLHLVARYADADLARLTARQIDYAWDHYGADNGGVDPVVIERDVRLDPASVYRLWTTEHGVRDFLDADAAIDAHIGGRYEFLFLDDRPDGFRGGEGCRILAMEPNRLLVFTWNSPPGMVTRGTHTWVVLLLTPIRMPLGEEGTRVRLAHWGHGQGPEWTENRAYFTAAWGRVLHRLADYAELAAAGT